MEKIGNIEEKTKWRGKNKKLQENCWGRKKKKINIKTGKIKLKTKQQRKRRQMVN